MSRVVILKWASRPSNSLLGFVDAEMPSGLIFYDVSVHEQNGKFWALPSSKLQASKDGVVLKDDRGKFKYAPVVGFRTREQRDLFSRGVLDALRRTYPDALEGVVE